MRKTLLALMLLAGSGMAQANVELKSNHPESYTVVQGDTLWGISGKFLRQPWKWPEIWHANPQVRNPHLIYPGDVLNLVYIDGKPRIMLNRAESRGTIKLSPNIRKTPIAESIECIPLMSINSFLLNNRIIEAQAELNAAPYVIAGEDGRVIGGNPDRVYVRGDIEDERSYEVFRQGKAYVDPLSGAFLGINADYIATSKVVERSDDELDDERRGSEGVGTIDLERTTQEVRMGDRLFVTEQREKPSSYCPEFSAPDRDLAGVILDVPRGVELVGKYDVVTISLGTMDGLKDGTILSIYKTGDTVRDPVTGKRVKLPDEHSGEVMVFRPYERVSYAIVLEAKRQMRVMDKIRNPL